MAPLTSALGVALCGAALLDCATCLGWGESLGSQNWPEALPGHAQPLPGTTTSGTVGSRAEQAHFSPPLPSLCASALGPTSVWSLKKVPNLSWFCKRQYWRKDYPSIPFWSMFGSS